MRNIELKILLKNSKEVERLLKQTGAKFQGELHQVDTYFNYPRGRLKIREINNKKFELIFYSRPNKKSSKISNYKIIKLTKKNAFQLKNLLSSYFGLKTIVKKFRLFWIYKHTRIHLDNIKNLGKFLELETVKTNLNSTKANAEQKKIIDVLRLNKYPKIDRSYSDLPINK